jgi:hypothetical protein
MMWAAAGIIAGILVTAVAGAYLWIVADPFDVGAASRALPGIPEEPLPVPSVCEIRLARARELMAKGRLYEAAAELDAGDPDGRHEAAMNELRAAIQQQLLEAARRTPAAGATGTGRRDQQRSGRP